MRIGIIGATGKAGSDIHREAVRRGHDVVAIVPDQVHQHVELTRQLVAVAGEKKPRLAFILGADGKSHTASGTMAVAVVDEIENPRHMNSRFTVSDS